MVEVMVRKALLEEIAEEAHHQAVIDYDGVSVEELVGAKKQMNRIMVREGETSKALTFTAANLLSIGLWDPKWLAGQFDERVPEFWGQFWDEEKEETHPTIEPAGDFGNYDTTNKLISQDLLDFWAEIICAVEKDDVADDHYERYYSRLYRSLVQGNHQTLRVGVIPWAEGFSTDALVVRGVPKQIYPEDPEVEEEDSAENNSAAEASW